MRANLINRLQSAAREDKLLYVGQRFVRTSSSTVSEQPVMDGSHKLAPCKRDWFDPGRAGSMGGLAKLDTPPVGLAERWIRSAHPASVRARRQEVLQSSMTFHITAGLWLEDTQVKISQALTVTETEVEPFTSMPRDPTIKSKVRETMANNADIRLGDAATIKKGE